MLSITAGAQKEMMSFIDQLGVNNIIVEAHEAVDRNELQTVRAVSPGLSFRDFRAIKENVSGLVAITPRKRFKPQKLLPKTNQDQPQLIDLDQTVFVQFGIFLLLALVLYQFLWKPYLRVRGYNVPTTSIPVP